MKIDVTEKFQHLPHAPIVEAVIEVRARAAVAWEETKISQQLKSALLDYPKASSQSEVTHEFKLKPGQPPETKQQDLGWKGLRLQSANEKHIAQFNRDGFIFSRLHPYESWEQLRDEAMRLWQIHAEIAHPTEIQRIGLRFINRIVLPPQDFRFEDYIQPYPEPPYDLDLPFVSFFHHDTLAVPGYPYAINVTRTIQPPQSPQTEGISLILDIDTFTLQSFELDKDMLNARLAEMRWLKNKVFFGSITEKALNNFQ
jgi:uncharacterized protein (TIGR04255 family)